MNKNSREIERLRKHVYELEEKLYVLQKMLEHEIELNKAMQDRLDQLRAEQLGISEDCHE